MRNKRWNPALRQTVAGEPGFEEHAKSLSSRGANSVAGKIKKLISDFRPSAVTLKGGYMQKLTGTSPHTMHFPTGKTIEESRDTNGRCTSMSVQYDDGSILKFRWSKLNGGRYEVAA